ncbi:MAG: sec-independent protein translocase protein TatA [Solirubrobacteraceae bacterium]|nr:sec-independent protein translocase protein TatA [Solirubrobacteraceae bacterium]
MPNVGAPELIIILIIALIVLGPKKLPEVGRSVGKGMREFKESLAGNDEDEEIPANTPSVTPMDPEHVTPVDAEYVPPVETPTGKSSE